MVQTTRPLDLPTKVVAPAVGEGGMAVRFVAEHLARSLHPGQAEPRAASVRA